MKKYVVRDFANKIQIIGASGFTPENVICEAPEGVDSDDGDVIDLQNEGQPNVSAKINDTKKAAKEAAKEAAIEAARLAGVAGVARVEDIKTAAANKTRTLPETNALIDKIVAHLGL